MKNAIKITVVASLIILSGVAVFLGTRLYNSREESISPARPDSIPAASEIDHCEIYSVTFNTVVASASPTASATASSVASAEASTNPTASATSSSVAQFTASTSPSPSASSTSSAIASAVASPTATATIAAKTSTPTSTSEPSLPVAGVSLPTIIGISAGAVLLFLALVLAI